MALLYSKFQVFSFIPQLLPSSPNKLKFGNINHFKLLQPPPPPPINNLNSSAIRILSIDFPDVSRNSNDIISSDLMPTSFFHEDLLVTNLQKFTR